MKTFRIVLMALSFAALFISCQKEIEVQENNEIIEHTSRAQENEEGEGINYAKLVDFPFLVDQIKPVFAEYNKGAEIKKLKRQRVLLSSNGPITSYSISYLEFKNVSYKLIAKVNETNTLIELGIIKIEYNNSFLSEFYGGRADVSNFQGTISSYTISDFLGQERSQIDECIKIVFGTTGSGGGGGTVVNPGGSNPNTNPNTNGPTTGNDSGGGFSGNSICLECTPCTCSPGHYCGENCRCSNRPQWKLVNCDENIQSEDIESTTRNSYWDCIDVLLGTGIFTDEEILAKRLKDCDAANDPWDVDPQAGNDGSNVYPDTEFCEKWISFRDACLPNSTETNDGWAYFMLHYNHLFNSTISNPNDCVSTEEMLEIIQVQIALDQFEADYGLNLTKFQRTAIKNNVSSGEDFEEDSWRVLLGQIGIDDLDYAISNTDIALWIFDFVDIDSGEDKLDFTNTLLEMKKEDNSIKLAKGEELYEEILNNIDFLVEDCMPSSINPVDYADLFNHQLPQECNDALDALGDNFYYQPIDDAHSPSINFDYYSVEITQRPDINGDQQPDSDEEIFDAIKADFLNLASGSYQNFDSECLMAPNSDISWDFIGYPGLQPTSIEQWSSSSPIGTIFLINADGSNIGELVEDHGAVIVSDYQDCCWLFSTIVTDESESQPFSGHRQFGFKSTQNGIEFFTRATDRAKLTTLMKTMLNDACSYQDYFNIGDITWTNLINNVKSLTEANGGSAIVRRTDYIRPKYKDVLNYLKSDVPLQINCH